MDKASRAPRSKWPEPVRIVMARPRLFLSVLAGFGVWLLLPILFDELRGVTRLLVAWDVGLVLYLALAFWMFAHSTVAQIHRQSMLEDEGGLAILVGTIVAAVASVAAVVAWLEQTTRAETFAPGALVFLFVTIALSWAFIHTMFALHYAHEYYSLHGKKGGAGLVFPHDPEPTYWDFVYLSFSIGTSTEVSDIAITSRRIRRTVAVHGIVSFFFNVTLIALSVGLIGDAIQN